MSATNRGRAREPGDFYRTPPYAVRRMVESVPLPDGGWLDAGAGDGAIVRAARAFPPFASRGVRWTAVELDPAHREALLDCAVDVVIGDFLDGSLDRSWTRCPFDVCVMNPPFTLALNFVRRAMEVCKTAVVALLRLNWLAGPEERTVWTGDHVPDAYVLPDRPSFKRAGTDATEYAWMVWRRQPDGTWYRRAPGGLWLLGRTPLSHRRRARPWRSP